MPSISRRRRGRSDTRRKEPPLAGGRQVRRVLTAPNRQAIREALHAEARKGGRGKGRQGARAKNARRPAWPMPGLGAVTGLWRRANGGGRGACASKEAAKERRAPPNPRMQRVQRRLHRLRRSMDRFQPLILFLILSLITLGAYGMWVTGAAERSLAAMAAAADRAVAAAGLRVRTVTVAGAGAVPDADIRAVLGVEPGVPMLNIDAEAARARLEAMPAVRSATVMRLLPDRVHVEIVERSAFALWQYQGRFAVIARDGTVLNTVNDRIPESLSHLPRVVGEGADRQAGALLDLLEAAPGLAARLKAASRVGDRRWNLLLDNGIEIRLPAEDASRAINDIVALDREHRLLARRIAFIDLRDPDVLVIRPVEGSEAESLGADDLDPADFNAGTVRGRRVGTDT
ncbi:MAG: cell division protein FtsQ/DivIB [Alphaproteobacteria bacterium]